MATLRSRTVGRRFTILYAAVFLLSGIGLIALIYLFSRSDMTVSAARQQPPPGGPPRASHSTSSTWNDNSRTYTPSSPGSSCSAR